MKRGRGRPPKLTPELRDKIAGKLRKGLPLELAAEACGVSRNTVAEWVRRGEGSDGRTADEIYVDFATVYRQARAQACEMHLTVVAEASLGWRPSRRDPTRRIRSRMSDVRLRAATFMLSRAWPEHFGQGRESVSIDVGGESDGEPIESGIHIEIIHAPPEPA